MGGNWVLSALLILPLVGAILIALLRGEPTNTKPATAEVDAVPNVRWWTDDLSPARGILIAMPIGAAVWAVICAIWYFL